MADPQGHAKQLKEAGWPIRDTPGRRLSNLRKTSERPAYDFAHAFKSGMSLDAIAEDTGFTPFSVIRELKKAKAWPVV